MLAVQDGYDPELPHIRSVLETSFGPLWVVHRLDKDTSGVMLLARSAAAHRDLNTQFQDRSVKKSYNAIIIGNPDWDQKRIVKPLRVNVGHRHRTIVDLEGGKPCVTGVKVIERFVGYCLVEAAPETGRRHQIRAHLAGEGYPIVCDGLYGNQEQLLRSNIDRQPRSESVGDEILIARIALHASSIEIDLPQIGSRRKFESQFPVDFERALVMMRLSSPG
jgi:RluA family pseudouridine synthase